jgi:hypothetical protein
MKSIPLINPFDQAVLTFDHGKCGYATLLPDGRLGADSGANRSRRDLNLRPPAPPVRPVRRQNSPYIAGNPRFLYLFG